MNRARHDLPVAVREGGDRVAEAERQHQADRELAPWEARRQRDDHRCADDHADGVGRDDVPGGRDRLVDALGDVGQQAHGDELGGADREPTEGEREDRQADVRGAGARHGPERGHLCVKSASEPAIPRMGLR